MKIGLILKTSRIPEALAVNHTENDDAMLTPARQAWMTHIDKSNDAIKRRKCQNSSH